MVRTRCFLLLWGWILCCQALAGRDVAIIHNKQVPRGEKEALLILPGFGSKIHGNKHQRRFFKQGQYDVFIPDYISRKSVEASVNNLEDFMQRQHLGEYRKVHVFGYIVGSWTINLWLQRHHTHNIATIVYDRSPLQERAPYALVKDRPRLIKLLAGPIMADFNATPYPPLSAPDIRVGIIVESRATKLIKRHKKTALSMGHLHWDMTQFRQEYLDAMYTLLNHDDMYTKVARIGPEVYHFIQHGRFSDQARRTPYDIDPFSNTTTH